MTPANLQEYLNKLVKNQLHISTMIWGAPSIGTSFIPFFEKVEKTRDLCLQGVCVYLTYGYGYFPRDKPNLPVLWVVVPGGLDTDKFPFGEVVKIY